MASAFAQRILREEQVPQAKTAHPTQNARRRHQLYTTATILVNRNIAPTR
jgi:hypothetical protein